MLKVKKEEAVTMNKEIKILFFLLLACLSLSLMAACTVPAAPAAPPSDGSSSPADKVEVVYFHRTQRCVKCLHAEEWTRYTVETYFKDELASGRVTLQVLDVEDKANAVIVKKYGAFGSSLFINTIRNNVDHIEEVTDIWTIVSNDKVFIEVVKEKIEKSLKGEA